MYELAAQVRGWLTTGRPVGLARTVTVEGMSSRWTGEAVAATDDAQVGMLIAGAADAALADGLATVRAGAKGRLVRLVIPDGAATAAGLACGGTVELFVQPADDVPIGAWAALAARRPVCLVTDLDGPEVGRTTWFEPAAPAGDRHTAELVRWFGRGSSAADVVDLPSGGMVLACAYWPITRMLVVGDGLLADALLAQAGLLGWSASATLDLPSALERIDHLTAADALVVLTHDRERDGPVLEHALTAETRAGYVGALGSRRTQAARAGWLADRGVGPELVADVHGPAGLDIGARTPAEIALAITAEILATRGGGSGSGLRERSGPIHHDGLNTPPARYAEGARRPAKDRA